MAPPAEDGGITGLETYLWYGTDELGAVDHDGDPATPSIPGLTVTAAAGPWEVTAAAGIVSYRWTLDGQTTYDSDRPGSFEQPAATHRYTTKGEHIITVTTRWTGTFSWSNETTGATGTSEPFPTVELSQQHPYQVDEVRAVPADDDRG